MVMNADQRRDSRRPRVLICDKIADVGVQMLRERTDVEIQTDLTAAELMSIVPDYDAIVVRSATNVTAEVIERALNLKIIGRAGSGLDNIDVVAAREREIAVVNSPDANTLSVAEYTMGLLLSLARSLPRADLSLKEGKWDKSALLGKGAFRPDFRHCRVRSNWPRGGRPRPGIWNEDPGQPAPADARIESGGRCRNCRSARVAGAIGLRYPACPHN